MAKRNINTVRSGDGWANRRDGAERVSKRYDTQAEAIADARSTAMREGWEHRIQGRDGKFRESNSSGNDPSPMPVAITPSNKAAMETMPSLAPRTPARSQFNRA